MTESESESESESEPELASESGETGESTEILDEVRDAAGAVIASLKRFIDASERVVENPAAFSQIVDNGRSVVEAFVGGFAAHASPPTDHEPEPNADGEDPVPES